jgi:hypothetical protein
VLTDPDVGEVWVMVPTADAKGEYCPKTRLRNLVRNLSKNTRTIAGVFSDTARARPAHRHEKYSERRCFTPFVSGRSERLIRCFRSCQTPGDAPRRKTRTHSESL